MMGVAESPRTNGCPAATVVPMTAPSGARRAAVQIRRASKHYGSGRKKVKILDGLDMTVTQGTIYGLLGASGCGKTTLLSCVCGLRKLDGGEITVLGSHPGDKDSGVPGHRVGYMPQELSLLHEFTVDNVMTYFGWLYGMSGKELKERSDFLIDLLQLTSKRSHQIKHLSGGQQRRVSFAAALLHDAELLILDEPTVGLDPELRQSIWDHLVKITERDSKTVIITTHYIEEAKHAHVIGLMRKGRLLAQDTPERLLATHRTDSLEEVFLNLSHRQENASRSDQKGSFLLGGGEEQFLQVVQDGSLRNPSWTSNGLKAVKEFGCSCKNNEKAVMASSRFDEPLGRCKSTRRTLFVGKWKALFMKNFVQMGRNLASLFFSLSFPFMTLVLFFVAVGHDPTNLPLAIVNEETAMINSTMSDCADYVQNGCNFTSLSCRYLHGLKQNNIVKEEFFPDKKSAIEAVRKGNAWGAVFIPENFTSALELRRENGNDLDDDVLTAGEISVYLDISNSIIGSLLKRKMMTEFQDFLRGVLVDCQNSPKFAQTPMNFHNPVYGKKNPSYGSFVAPGIINSIMYFSVVGMTAITMVKEKEEGLWNRLMVAGITPWEILLSHAFTNLWLIAVQTAEVLVVCLAIIGLECKGSVLLMGAHVFLHGVIGMAFGLIVSLICRNVAEANYLSTGSFYSYLLLCGIIWPVEGLPWFMGLVSRFLPLTLASASLRDIMVKGWGLAWPSVYCGYLATISWIIFFFACSYVILKFRKS
ncbi:ABC transporter G family member 23-like [Ischnura elegans]|uniref:ABC transporter G family member 23-like n=1 Tax=Ischnura elegans TaxID=197161 RepID=UPI001ED8B64A|nr:ABC transporter G family member 23-like [Ischnura elegans]